MRKKIRFVLCLLILSLLSFGSSLAQKQQSPPQAPEAPVTAELGALRLAGEIPGSRASHPGRQSDWPSIASAKDGSLYVAYIEWNDKDADRVVVRKKPPQGEWSAAVVIDDGNWDHYWPAIVARGQGALAIWSGQSEGNFELYVAEISANNRSSKPLRLTHAPHSDFNVRAVSDEKGNVTIVWQSFRLGNADIYARRLTGDRWGPEVRVSTSDANDWEPAVALDRRGVAWISWDSYHHGNYDVLLRSFDGQKLGGPIAVTTESTAQFHSSVAVDGEGRVWVAWDDAGQNWGKDYSRSSAAPGSQGLHYARSLGLRVYANGRVREPSVTLSQVLGGRMTRYAELPHLAVNGDGALWMIFRHWTLPKPSEIYHFYATRLSGDAWALPWKLSMSSGHNTQHASVAVSPSGGLSVAYSSDGRSETNVPKEQAHALHYVVNVSELPEGGAPPKVGFKEVDLPAPGVRPPQRPRHTMSVSGKTYHLLLGDCHRHTDIRGHSGVDGSILDTYRYGMDAAQLDFLGTADHNEVMGGRWPDGLRDYQWWWTQKAVDLMSHAPAFIGIYSYEHSMSRPGGHRNILFLNRGAPLRMIDRSRGREAPDNQPPELWKWMEANVVSQSGQKAVIVPHTFASGPLADWNWPNARFDCLLEIYQGCRGSYEAWRLPEQEKRGPTQTDDPGHFARDALAKDNIYGFVSFSDHGSTHNSWAGVWVLTQDRKGILDGMYDRRTFAASDEIILKVTADGHMVGEEFQAAVGKGPLIEASIEAPDEILRVDIVKDGKYVYTTRPGTRGAKITWRDNDTRSGRSYYYLRVFQRDPENPEGDPEIGWASPFYVTYR
jgi:hypothetical protein